MSAAEGALKTVSVRLADIVLEPALQVRHAMDEPTVRQYADAMRAGAVFPPIKVARPNGACLLVGGWHRVAAAKAVGRDTIEAIVLDAPMEALRWIAAQDNMTHGLRLKPREARAAFKAYVHAGMHRLPGGRFKSSREIANDLHGMRSYRTILTWMEQDFPATYRAMQGREDIEGGPGLSPLPPPDPLAPAREHVQQIIALARGVPDPTHRGELIGLLKAAQKAVEEVGEWVPPEPDDFEF
jgi:hypothetical protein